MLLLACTDLDQETVVYQNFDGAGRLVSEKIKGYDCCEGFSIKTYNYDTLGNIIEVFGNTDGSRSREIYQYENNKLIFEKHYVILNDSLNSNFDIDNDSIDYIIERGCYYNGNQKSSRNLYFFDRLSNRDTSSLRIREYDSLGNIIVHTEFSKERNYLEENPLPQASKYVKYTIFEDKIQGSIDTLKIVQESGLFNPRGL